MAIGDRIPTELTAPATLNTTASSFFTNAGASFRTQITQIYLCNTGTSTRTITLYKNGTAVSNQILNSITLPANASTVLDTKLVSTGTQIIAAKQDAGTDVNIAIYGVVEQIA